MFSEGYMYVLCFDNLGVVFKEVGFRICYYYVYFIWFYGFINIVICLVFYYRNMKECKEDKSIGF